MWTLGGEYIPAAFVKGLPALIELGQTGGETRD